MHITTISSREFNQDIGRAKRESIFGPVFITDRGHPAHVFMTIEEYQKITSTKESIIDLLTMPSAADIDFMPERLNQPLYQPAEFS